MFLSKILDISARKGAKFNKFISEFCPNLAKSDFLVNYYQNTAHADSFCSLMSKLCDRPLSFFFLQKMANSANFLGWFYDKDVFTPL